MRKIVKCSVGEFHILVLMENGDVYRAGNPLDKIHISKVGEFQKVHEVSNIVNISAGKNFSLLLKENGKVLIMGYCPEMPIGLKHKGFIVPQYEEIEELHNIISFASGNDHAVFLDQNGLLMGTGNDDYYQSGTKAKNKYSKISKNVKNCFAKDNVTAIIDKDNNLRLMGENKFGQLFDGDDEKISLTLAHKNVKSIAFGYGFSFITKTNGDIIARGANCSGQLGNGTIDYDFNLMKFEKFKDVNRISLGREHSVLLKEDGSVWFAGDSEAYQATESPENGHVFFRVIDAPKEGEGKIKEVVAKDGLTFLLSEKGNLYSETSFPDTVEVSYAGTNFNLIDIW